ncbi:MAG: hypothetical protein COZ18_16230 [Flexibacter sp. CG_4_10_14_3_um_filter_32_15]|nr:MAG: hypothetical protein COZ18_16230 [Flexibacter sp. CG_4_10_14_3_um_filter_32_15]
MKFKHLIFALLTVASASSFTGCNESTPDPKAPEPCVTCENETVVNTLDNVEGVVKRYSTGNPNAEPLYIITIQKLYLETDGYSYGNDSLFIPCPPLSKEFQQVGKKILISGSVKSCSGLLNDISSNPEAWYGSKLDLESITKR